MFIFNEYVLAIIGGLLPAFIWIIFWRREDRRRPEPKKLILLAFIAGMIAVPIAIELQQWVASVLLDNHRVEDVFVSNFLMAGTAVLLWAAIEEILKYVLARVSVLWRDEVDEPIDPMIYLLTTAIGFSALENILFLFKPLSQNNFISAIITGDLRFIGATLVHIASSAIVGFFISLSFYRRKAAKRLYIFIGLILSIALHTLFNFFIILSQGPVIIAGFAIVWAAIVVVLAIFEKAKRVHPY